MRTRGMGRSLVAISGTAAGAVLLAVTAGCTAQPGDVNAADGKHRSPVHIEISRTPSGGGAPSSAAPVPKSSPAVLWAPGDSGPKVRELQARLRQVDWLFDGPTGTYDDLTENAVRGFQGKRGLPRTGEVDSVTWQRLLKMTHAPGRGPGPALYDGPGAVHQQDEPHPALDDRRADGLDDGGPVRYGEHAHA